MTAESSCLPHPSPLAAKKARNAAWASGAAKPDSGEHPNRPCPSECEAGSLVPVHAHHLVNPRSHGQWSRVAQFAYWLREEIAGEV